MTADVRQPIDLFICMTCQPAGWSEGERPGARLYGAVREALAQRASLPVQVHPIECLAVCKRPCTVAVSAPGKWAYVIGDLDAGTDAPALLEYAAAYADSASGTPPLKERPPAIRRGTVARIPPHSISKETADACE